MKQSRIVAFAAIALALWSCGRKNTTTPPDTNQSPETVLIATPYDTSFIKTPGAGVPTAVIYRYHAHWYGSDPDGKVVGFIVIVTDTNGAPGVTQFLDPHNFTTRSDSIFAFKVNANSQRYPHTLWVLAVDDKGKADFSPAHVILNAEDRYLPEPVLDSSYAVTPGGQRIALTDNNQSRTDAPRDTIPLGSSVHFSWHATTQDPFGKITGYRIRLGDINTVVQNTFADFPASALRNGRNEFHLRGIDAVGGETGSGGGEDTLRVFAYNFAPSTWIADPNAGGAPPEMRPIQQKFIELRGGQVFFHNEGDTIPRTSSVQIVFGGWDRDGQVRGFSVGVQQIAVSGVGANTLPPTPTTPPPGFLGVFEPYVNTPYQFDVDADIRSGTRIFTATSFDYEGQKDPRSASIRVIYGLRPYFKASTISISTSSPKASYPGFPVDDFGNPDTSVVIVGSGQPSADDKITLSCVAYDANDLTGKTKINNSAAYSITLDPQSSKSTFFEDAAGLPTILLMDSDKQPLKKGLHILQVVADDFPPGGQTLADGRTSTVLIPFFYQSKTP